MYRCIVRCAIFYAVCTTVPRSYTEAEARLWSFCWIIQSHDMCSDFRSQANIFIYSDLLENRKYVYWSIDVYLIWNPLFELLWTPYRVHKNTAITRCLNYLVNIQWTYDIWNIWVNFLLVIQYNAVNMCPGCTIMQLITFYSRTHPASAHVQSSGIGWMPI